MDSRLRAVRLERGLRVIDLAILANISTCLVWRLETGQRVSRRKKIQVARALKLELGQVFPEEAGDGTPLASGR